MLGFVRLEDRGATDAFLFALSEGLEARGLSLAGAVQANVETRADLKCDMNLHVLPSREEICISQRLGAGSRGCRLDPNGLERAVGLAEARLNAGADLLIVNKFGKAELDGGGFRPLVAKALDLGVPVLTGVAFGNTAAFETFSGGLAVEVGASEADVLGWLEAVRAEA
ncbi:MAG: DUF2478 domain-containing protein [Pseudomonadota bacterium]